jgi:hypothetical protein
MIRQVFRASLERLITRLLFVAFIRSSLSQKDGERLLLTPVSVRSGPLQKESYNFSIFENFTVFDPLTN